MAKKNKLKKYSSDVTLTDNKKANVVLLLLDAAILILLFALGFWKIEDLAKIEFSSNSLAMNIAIYVAVYLATSHWFSPDLDVRVNRPGKGSFPFGALLKLSARGVKGGGFPIAWVSKMFLTIFNPIHMLINRIWYYFWQPFAFMVTHRGAIHLPLYGSACKIFYLSTGVYLVGLFLRTPGIESLVPLGFLPNASFVAWNKLVLSSLLGGGLMTTALAAVVMADLRHIAVDWYDTLRKGTNFVPPPTIAPRGLVAVVLTGLFFKK